MRAREWVPGCTASLVVVSKDEPALSETLDRLVEQSSSMSRALVSEVEIVVVDASRGRLDEIRRSHPGVRWIDFDQPAGISITIAHQRNVGVRASTGDVIVFVDSGCRPQDLWLEHLVRPIVLDGERMTSGQVGSVRPSVAYSMERAGRSTPTYLAECATINVAFRRDVYDEIGPFDERFRYGSDIDFSWRAVHRGVRIRFVPDAVVLHDWGTRSRQVRRAYAYGKGRARLYRKHIFGRDPQSIHKRTLNVHDAVPLCYSAFLLGLPIARRHTSYLLVVALPLWRSRKEQPVAILVEHLVLAIGVLSGALEFLVGHDESV